MTDDLNKNEPSADAPENEDNHVEKEFFDQTGQSSDASEYEGLSASFRPRWQRSPLLAAFFIPLSLFLIYLLWTDLVFGVRGLFVRSPQDIGDAVEALPAGKVRHNTWVHMKGLVSIQSQLPIPRTKSRGRVDGYYVYYVLLGTNNRILVKRFSREGMITERMPTEFTGRLLRISDVEEGVRLQEYYRNNVTDPSSDILFREFQEESADAADAATAPTAVLNSIEKLRETNPTLITDLGEKFTLRPNMKMDVKAYYLPDMVVSFNREFASNIQLTLTGGSSKGGACPAGVGGSVILKRDPETLILPNQNVTGEDHIPTGDATALAACPSCPETDVPIVHPPVIVRIPVNTTVIDLNTKKEIAFAADGTFTVAGAACGSNPARVTVEITHRPFEQLNDCYRWLIAQGYPFAPLSGAVQAEGDWDIVAHIADNEVRQLKETHRIRRDCSEKDAGRAPDCVVIAPALRVAPRWKFLFNIPVQDIRVQGQELVVMHARTDFPPLYDEATENLDLGDGNTKTSRILKARQGEDAYRLPLSMVSKLKFYSPTIIQDDAFILLEGVTPTDWTILWKIPVVLILLILLALNLRAILRRLFLRPRT
ncbi:MAG: hypothetical protein CVU65_12795 [Deltaproteobacteria bacterium HGW-Deltaproteobacteria-22]|nr:MAG: hypothetical protein CVU65_12795 [Deltaproteobacteria bacterium HGW-Deltaproteobacteria-22]